MEAKCGHTEIELPPGCYIVFASQFVFVPDGLPFPWIIVSSHFSIVMVECDEKASVQLYNPAHRQGINPAGDIALSLVEKQGVPQEKADRLVEAANSVLQHLPKTSQDIALERLFEEARKKRGEKDK